MYTTCIQLSVPEHHPHRAKIISFRVEKAKLQNTESNEANKARSSNIGCVLIMILIWYEYPKLVIDLEPDQHHL